MNKPISLVLYNENPINLIDAYMEYITLMYITAKMGQIYGYAWSNWEPWLVKVRALVGQIEGFFLLKLGAMVGAMVS